MSKSKSLDPSRKEQLSTLLRQLQPKLTLSGVVLWVTLTIIGVLAFVVRIIPIRYGLTLSEFDPFWHYYVAQRVVDQGFLSVFGWIDTRSWIALPHVVDGITVYGRDVVSTTPLGLPYTVAALYLFLKALGAQMTLLEFSIFFPPLMGAVTSVAIFFLAKDLDGKVAGLLAALFLALNDAFISRTTLGFLKHETIGILAIIIASLLFLRSIESKKPVSHSFLYAILAGLMMFYLNISWGAYTFLLALVPLFVITLALMGRYNSRILLSYSIAMGLSFILTLPFPRHGDAILTSISSLPALLAFLLLFLFEFLKPIKTVRSRLGLTILVLGVSGFGFLLLAQIGFIAPLAGKIVAVLDPTQRGTIAGPIVESVAEHRMSSWATFFVQFGPLVLLAPLGLFFAIKRQRPIDVYMLLFGLLALYFAASYVRLTLIMAAAFSLLGAYGFIELVKPFARTTRTFRVSRRGRMKPSVPVELGVALIVLIAAMMVPTFTQAVKGADVPTTLASSGIPTRQPIPDWMEALSWIQNNIPPGTAVVSWWDYGYWIEMGGNSTSVADNATIDTETIARIGEIMMSNDTTAVQLMRKHFKTDYIAIFVTTVPTSTGQRQPWMWGDEGKWTWMALIAGKNVTELTDTSLTQRYGVPLPRSDTVMGEVITYALTGSGGPSNAVFYWPPDNVNTFLSSNGFVFILKARP